MLPAILIQLFWVSIILIGFVGLNYIGKLFLHFKVEKAFNDYIEKNSILELVFFSLCVGAGLFILPVVISYIFELPILVLTIYYSILLITAVASLCFERNIYLTQLRNKIGKPSHRWVIPGLLVLIVIAIDYAYSLWIGSPLYGDAPLHLAKIQMFINTKQLSLADPLVGYNGILDLRYSTNLFLAFEGLIAVMVHTTADKVWFYSYAFYRFISWISLFVLAKTFLPKSSPKQWPYLILVICPFIYSGYFFSQAELPHALVLVWISLFLVGLFILLKYNSSFLILLATVLIASTHSLGSLNTIGFILLVILGLSIMKQINKKQLVTLFISTIVLCIPVLANAVQPSRSTNVSLYNNQVTGYGIHGVDFNVYGKHLTYSLPNLKTETIAYSPLDWRFLLFIPIFIFLIYVLRKINNQSLRLTGYALLLIISLALFNVVYMSLIGSIYLIWKYRDKRLRYVVVLLALYYGLVAYNPLIITFAKGRLPYWAIARFQDFNMLAYITPIIGMLFIYNISNKYMRIPRRYSSPYWLLVFIFFAILLPFNRFPINLGNVLINNDALHSLSKSDYTQFNQLEAIKPYIYGHVVYSNSYRMVSYLSMVSAGDNTGFIDDQQANQAQNISMRDSCQQILTSGLDLSNLEAARITRIVLLPGFVPDTSGNISFTKSAKGSIPLSQLAQKLPYLKLVKQIGQTRIYSVINEPNLKLSVNNYCHIPYKQ